MCSKFSVWLAGEQLRIRMHTENLSLIKDRRYHFRSYKNCFKASETIDWLLETHQCPTREAAVFVLNILQNFGVFHHVCDDHKFKDDMLFFRFRKDDRTWKHDRDSQVFHNGEMIFNWLVSKRMRSTREAELTQSGSHTLTFYGKELVDWLIKSGAAVTTEEAVKFGKELVDYSIIRQVNDECHFRDDSIPYMFLLNYRRLVSLSHILTTSLESENNSGSRGIPISSRTHFINHRQRKISSESETENAPPEFRFRRHYRSLSMDSKTDSDDSPPSGAGQLSNRSSYAEGSYDSSGSDDMTPPNGASNGSLKSVLLRHASVEELEDPDTPYVKKFVRVFCDSVGYGCVIRGSSPTYVQTVDPSGPAAMAGIKVRQYIYSVNGENVLRQKHRYVAKLISSNDNHVDLVVMSHIRDASL